jgi:hypothetical protein
MYMYICNNYYVSDFREKYIFNIGDYNLRAFLTIFLKLKNEFSYCLAFVLLYFLYNFVLSLKFYCELVGILDNELLEHFLSY